MGFQKIGISLVANGAAKFARDLGYVNSSFIRYQRSVVQYTNSVVSSFRRQYVEAARARDSLIRTETQLTERKIRLEMQQVAATNRVVQANNRVLLALQTLTNAKTRTMAMEMRYEAALDREEEATNNLNNVTIDLADTERELTLTKQRLAMASVDVKGKFIQFFKALKDGESSTGKLGEVLKVLSGRFSEGVMGAAGISGAMSKAIPQAAAFSLVLDGLKIVIDTLVTGFRIVMGVITLLIGIFKKIISIVGKAIGWFAKLAFEVSKKVVTAIWSLIKLPFNIVWKGLTSIWESLKRIGEIAIGMNLSNLMWNLGRKILETGNIAFEAASHFQLLRIRLTGLVQRDLAENFGVPFSESLDTAKEHVKELVSWISILGVKSIFSTEAISRTLTLAMAYGFTEDQAKSLTESVVRFATGMGLENDAMVAIIENFGQMKAAGKITGTELRDLARGAFLPVNRVIEIMGENMKLDADQTANLKEELQDLTKEGKISIDEFFKAFEQMTAHDFPNAIESASVSWEVFRSNTRDFIESVIGWRVITPTLDLVADKMSKLLSKMMTPKVFTAMEELGTSIKGLVETVWNSLNDLFGLGNDPEKMVLGFIAKVKLGVELVQRILTGKGQQRILTIADYFKIPHETINKVTGIIDYIKRNKGVISDLFTNPGGESFRAFVNTFILPALGAIFKFVVYTLLPGIYNKVVEVLPKVKTFVIEQLGLLGEWIVNTFVPTYLDKLGAWFSNMVGEDSPLNSFYNLIKEIFLFVGKSLMFASDNAFFEGLPVETQEAMKLHAPEAVPQPPSNNALVVAFENAKKAAIELADQGIEYLKGKLGELATAGWDALTTSFQKFKDEKIASIKETLGLQGIDLDKEIVQPIKDIASAISSITGIQTLVDLSKAMSTFATGINDIKEALGGEADIKILSFLDNLARILKIMEFIPAIANPIKLVFDSISNGLDALGRLFSAFSTMPSLSEILSELVGSDTVGEAAKVVIDINKEFFSNLLSNPVTDEIDARSSLIYNIFSELYDQLVGHSIVPDIVKDVNKEIGTNLIGATTVAKLAAKSATLYATGANVMRGLWDGMRSVWSLILIWWENNVADKLQAITETSWQIASPSKLFEKMGKNVMLGMYQGLKKNARYPINMMQNTVNAVPVGAMSGSGGNTNYVYNTNNYNLGGVRTAGTARDVVGHFDTMRIIGK